jgi:hypothetical protein
VKYVTIVKTRHLNGSRPFVCLPWESACAGSGMKCSLLTKRSAGDVPSTLQPAAQSFVVTPVSHSCVGWGSQRVSRDADLWYSTPGTCILFHHWQRRFLRSVMLCGLPNFPFHLIPPIKAIRWMVDAWTRSLHQVSDDGL